MKIPRKIVNKWKVLYDHGDIIEISKEYKLDKRTVSKGLKGECDTNVFSAISSFYIKKDALLKTA